MTKVSVKDGNLEGALKKFKVQVARSGVPSEIKKREELKENIKNSRKKHKRNKGE